MSARNTGWLAIREGDVGGTPYTHPDYDPNRFFIRDLGVVVLDKAMKMKEYGAPPKVDQLDALQPSSSTTFTAVGYGLQQSFSDAASWKECTPCAGQRVQVGDAVIAVLSPEDDPRVDTSRSSSASSAVGSARC